MTQISNFNDVYSTDNSANVFIPIGNNSTNGSSNVLGNQDIVINITTEIEQGYVDKHLRPFIRITDLTSGNIDFYDFPTGFR